MTPQARKTDVAAEKQTKTALGDDDAIEKFEHEVGSFDITVEAREAQLFESALSLKDSVRIYRYGVCWSMLFSTCVIMEGYDLTLMGSFFGYPEFNKKYGNLQPDGTYQLTASWQSAINSLTQAGMVIGVMCSGYLVDKFGYKRTNLGALLFMVGAIFIPFFAPTVKVLAIGALITGIPWGFFQGITCSYASDVAPVALRPILTTYVNMSWVIGQLISAGVLRGLLNRADQWGYRIPFAIQWVWPIPLIVGTLLAPESPYYLIRKGREDEALAVVKRLTVKEEGSGFSAEGAVAMMVHTNKIEKAMSEGTTYLDCFKGIDLRRTEIVCCVYAIQNMCGSSLMGYSNYFLQQAGFSAENAFNLSIGQSSIGLIGTAASWWLMKKAGRRDIYIYGLVVLFALLLIIGSLGFVDLPNAKASNSIGALLLIFTFVYDFTVGPVCYAIVSELGSTRLRAKSIVLARDAYNLFGFANTFLMPRFINPTSWNFGAKTAFVYAGIVFISVVYCYFRLPEARGRTYAELDILFERQISARNFSKTAVDPFATGEANSEKSEPKDRYVMEHRENI